MPAMKAIGTPVLVNGRKVGTVSGQTYTSARRRSHFCRKFNGWGIQLDIIRDLKRMNVHEITIVVDGKPMFSTMNDWDRHARIGTLNPDYGEQAFLEEQYFR
jgi:hypothetical protein